MEEYVIKTHELLTRRWKRKSKLATQEAVEIGEPEMVKGDGLVASNSNPVFVQEDRPEAFIFKVRNLIGYPPDAFMVTVDSDKQELVIRTTNKKYFKRFQIGDMVRDKLPLEQEAVSTQFGNGVLVVAYKKPVQVVYREAQRKAEFEKLNAKKPQEGDLECSVQ